MTMQVARCLQCGCLLPPVTAPSHVCPAQWNSMFPQHWHESAIRQIAREEIRAALSEQTGKGEQL